MPTAVQAYQLNNIYISGASSSISKASLQVIKTYSKVLSRSAFNIVNRVSEMFSEIDSSLHYSIAVISFQLK